MAASCLVQVAWATLFFRNHDFQETTSGESQIKTLLVGLGPESPWGAFL